MGTQIGVHLIRAAWTEEVEELLADAAGNDPTYTVADLRKEVFDGQTHLIAVRDGAATVGYFCYWIDRYGTAAEMVIQAGASFLSFSNALKRAMPQIEALARRHGAEYIRSHPSSPVKARALRRAGFKQSEIVVRKAV